MLTITAARQRLQKAGGLVQEEKRSATRFSRRVSIADLERHALELAKQLQITVRWWTGNREARARAFVKSRRIDVERITDETTYCVFLHECGHCETDVAGRRLGKDFIVGTVLYNSAGESRAWTWAKQHALTWTPAMQTELRRALRCVRPYATQGSADPLWRELDKIHGRLTIGHAHWRLQTLGGRTIAEARARLAQVAR